MTKPTSPHLRHRRAAHPGRTAAEVDAHVQRKTDHLRALHAVGRPHRSAAQVEARIEKHLKADQGQRRSGHRGKPAAG